MHAGFGDILEIHGYVPKIANNQMSEIQLKLKGTVFREREGDQKGKKTLSGGVGWDP